ncbi:calcium/proton antiporter [Salmonella enterica subsp. enterica]|uniref:Calcium/proton antiporter n=1 Tax=Salmonella enterica I TaxID=59201 RepID=A0A3S4HZN8_SALET|nr:calcium/proton antiporter [Salmonella enterica subsp. enterica]
MLIQTKTHQSLFIYEHEDEGDDDNPHHGKPSAHSSGWHTVWLLIHLIAVIAVTKMNASPLEALLTSMNAPVAFTGFLVALLILSPEGLGALKAVLNNQVSAGNESVLRIGVGDDFINRAGRHAHRLGDR